MKKYSEECIAKDKRLYELGKERGKLQQALSENLREMKEIFKWFYLEQGHCPIQPICCHYYNERKYRNADFVRRNGEYVRKSNKTKLKKKK